MQAVPVAVPVSTTMTCPTTATVLRKATYVKTIDLVKSLNVDINKLKDELANLKELENKPAIDVPGLETEATTAGSLSKGSSDSGSFQGKRPYHQQRLQPHVGFNLCVLVGKANVVVDKLRVDKSRVRLAEVEVGDETGVVSLRARDNQISMLETISSQSGSIVLRNCSIELYQGKHLRLTVTKWGKMTSYPDGVQSTPTPPVYINEEMNISKVDLNMLMQDVNPNLEVSSAWSTSSSSHPKGGKFGDDRSRERKQQGHGYQRRRNNNNMGYVDNRRINRRAYINPNAPSQNPNMHANHASFPMTTTTQNFTNYDQRSTIRHQDELIEHQKHLILLQQYEMQQQQLQYGMYHRQMFHTNSPARVNMMQVPNVDSATVTSNFIPSSATNEENSIAPDTPGATDMTAHNFTLHQQQQQQHSQTQFTEKDNTMLYSAQSEDTSYLSMVAQAPEQQQQQHQSRGQHTATPDSWMRGDTNIMTQTEIEMPQSPRMNPQAVIFAPTYYPPPFPFPPQAVSAAGGGGNISEVMYGSDVAAPAEQGNVQNTNMDHVGRGNATES